MFATGTGIAPFASLIREPQTYEDYDQIILTHTCREVAELEYGRQLVDQVKNDELMAELVGAENLQKLVYYPTTTREDSPKMGRITTLIKDGTLFGDLGVTDFGPDQDRAMVCGSIGLNTDIKESLKVMVCARVPIRNPRNMWLKRPCWVTPLKTVAPWSPRVKSRTLGGFSALTLENKGLRG